MPVQPPRSYAEALALELPAALELLRVQAVDNWAADGGNPGRPEPAHSSPAAAGDDFHARIEAAIARHLPPDDEPATLADPPGLADLPEPLIAYRPGAPELSSSSSGDGCAGLVELHRRGDEWHFADLSQPGPADG